MRTSALLVSAIEELAKQVTELEGEQLAPRVRALEAIVAQLQAAATPAPESPHGEQSAPSALEEAPGSEASVRTSPPASPERRLAGTYPLHASAGPDPEPGPEPEDIRRGPAAKDGEAIGFDAKDRELGPLVKDVELGTPAKHADPCGGWVVRDVELRPEAKDAVPGPSASSLDAGSGGSEPVSLRGSVWEAALLVLIGDGVLSLAEAGLTGMLFVINVMLQAAFLFVLDATVASSPYTQDFKSDVLRQRLLSDHSLGNADLSRLTSRAESVCRTGHGGGLAGGAWGEAKAFMRLDGGEPGAPGAVVGLIAMLIWSLFVLRGVRRTFLLSQAVLALEQPAGRPARRVLRAKPWLSLVITQLPAGHKAFALAGALMWLALALAWLLYGLYFLGTTTNVADLVLHALLLEAVRGLDELLFQALLSRRAQATVLACRLRPGCGQHLAVAPAPRWARFAWCQCSHGAEVGMLVRLLAVVGVLAVSCFMYLAPTMKDMKEISDLICGGSRNFSWIEHPIAGMPYFAAISADQQDELQCFNAARHEMLRLRAGFPPAFSNEAVDPELLRMLNGTHALCTPQGAAPRPGALNCPQGSLTNSWRFESLSTEDLLSGPGCNDQDVMYRVLRSTCLHGSVNGRRFADLFPAAALLQNRTRCGDVADVCACGAGTLAGGRCAPEPVPLTVQGFAWSPAFRDVLRGVCGQTCGLCRSALAPPRPR